MWSEMFTHDYENGEKVAIILLDTQGIFDHQSSRRDCTTTFALNMMFALVQCYNIMQNIQKDDLGNLEMFTEYGRVALQQSNEKLFQKLVFLVRNWPNSFEIGHGWQDQVIDEVLNGNDKQALESQQTQTRIKSSFDLVTAFLMPFPGKTIAQGRFTGKLSEIDKEFLDSMKELVPAIFAPGKLIIKTINSQKVRVNDLLSY